MDWSDRIGRRIKLRDLHILQAVAQHGSMAKAARHLAVSQPVVSKVIADLERELGRPLLDRDRHGAEPTVYGAALLKHGLAVFDELRQSVKEIEYLADPTTGELRIATQSVMVAGFLPAVIRSLHRRHPNLTIHVTLSVAVDTLYRELRERNVDLILGRICRRLWKKTSTQTSCSTTRSSSSLDEGIDGRVVARSSLSNSFTSPGCSRPMEAPPHSLQRRCSGRAVYRCRIEEPSALPCRCRRLGRKRSLSVDPTRVAGTLWRQPPLGKGLTFKVPVSSSPVGIVTLKRRTINPVAQLFIDHAREVAKSLAKKN